MLIAICMLFFGLVGLFFTIKTYKEIRAGAETNQRVQELSNSAREAALSVLRRELQQLVLFDAAAALVLLFLFGFATSFSFVAGAACSFIAGWAGTHAAAQGGMRSAQAASESNAGAALLYAFNGGAVTGLCAASLAILGLGFLYVFVHSPDAVHALAGFGLGASSAAVFAFIGASSAEADSGASAAGGYPGAVAGISSDIFESYTCSLIACLMIGATLTVSGELAQVLRAQLMYTPFVMGILGLLSGLIAVRMMEGMKDSDPAAALRSANAIAAALFVILMLLYALVSEAIGFWHWVAIAGGSICGIVLSRIAEHFATDNTGEAQFPRTIDGCVYPFLTIAAAVGLAAWCGGGGPDGLYCVALAAVAMLATTGVALSVDAFAPVAESARKLSKAAAEADAPAIAARLAHVGETRAGVGRVYAAGSALFTALALFSAFTLIVSSELPALTALGVTSPALLAGLLLGAALPPAALRGGPKTPALLAVAVPVLAGYLVSPLALAGVLLGAALVSMLLNQFLGAEEGGPDGWNTGKVGLSALNTLIKLMGVVALLIAPLLV